MGLPLERKFIFKSISVWIMYFAVAWLGLKLATLNANTSPFWPASGLAIGLITRWGLRYSWAIFLGAFSANFVLSDIGLASSVFIALGNMSEAIVGSLIVDYFVKSKVLYPYHQSCGIVGASVFSSVISASIGALTLGFLQGNLQHFGSIFTTWWVGDFIGGILVTPLCLLQTRKLRSIGPRQIPLAMALGLISSLGLFQSASTVSLTYIIFPLLLAIASKMHRSALYVFTLTVAIVTVYATFGGDGLFRTAEINTQLIHLQVLIASIAITGLVLADFRDTNHLGATSIILFVGWSLTALVFHTLYTRSQEQVTSSFSNVVSQAKMNFEQHVLRNYVAFHSAAGLYAASRSVNRDEWRLFYNSIHDAVKDAGLLGLGFISKVESTNLPDFVRRTSADGSPDFHVKLVPHVENLADRKFSYVITYIEPIDRNKNAEGLDVASEINRKKAADLAWSSGTFALTDVITLVQDSERKKGTLLYYPVFKRPSNATNADKELLGWIYAPIILENLFAQAFGSAKVPELDYSIVMLGDDHELLRSPGFTDDGKELEASINLGFADRNFQVKFKSSKSFVTSVGFAPVWAGAVGTFFTLLLAVIFAVIKATNDTVNRIVKEKTEQFEMSGKIARVGGWEFNLQSRRLTWSQTTREIHEVPRDYVPTYEAALEFYPPEARIQVEQAIQRCTSDGTDWDLELEFKTTSGSPRWVRVMGKPNWSGSKVIGLYGAFQDITDRRTREALFVQTAKLVSLGEMASGIAHEINNPLTVILSASWKLRKIIEGNAIAETCRSSLDLMDKTVMRIGKIISSLRSFARDGSADAKSDVSMDEVITNVVGLSARRFENAGIKFSAPHNLSGMLSCRQVEIEQVLINLLNNAYDAVIDLNEKWVSLEVTESSNSWSITVADSGSGIPKHIADRIMTPFFTTKPVGKGTGLGLSISLSIAKAHGGDLVCDHFSENTKFTLILPKATSIPEVAA